MLSLTFQSLMARLRFWWQFKELNLINPGESPTINSASCAQAGALTSRTISIPSKQHSLRKVKRFHLLEHIYIKVPIKILFLWEQFKKIIKRAVDGLLNFVISDDIRHNIYVQVPCMAWCIGKQCDTLCTVS